MQYFILFLLTFCTYREQIPFFLPKVIRILSRNKKGIF
ncbi:hypothetical protein BCE_0615 [Bacillus cereus ATCC 10987]|uniref:Uncharacterized protein n=1 Tax=Bacillus cereus (strain ATCC 10987 / NRS 248) TaxID=222523 RepID=Q73DU6_BACC1|nr:hypothetical protein BCE_0615 [Bacillus cereus ATCC 10987]